MSKDNVVNYPNSIDTRIALLELCVTNINDTMKDIKSDLREIKTEITSGFPEIRTEMHTGFSEIRTEMHTGFSEIRTEMHTGFSEIKYEMNKGFTDIRKEMKSDHRWLLSFTIGLSSSLAALILGVVGIMAHGFHWF